VRTEPLPRAGGPKHVFSASAMREISPPDAIFSMAFGSSPRFGDTKNSTASLREGDASAAITVT
jgi:hypothetical protein